MTSSLQVFTRDNLSLLPLNALLAINARIVANPEVIRKQAPGNRSDGFPMPDTFCFFQCRPARKLPANAGTLDY